MNYYLPTTLKILKAYARMEEQGIEGENIRSAKARIEGMMDKVVDGFEAQLDKLFQDDAMDYHHRRAGAGADAGEGWPVRRRRHDPGGLKKRERGCKPRSRFS